MDIVAGGGEAKEAWAEGGAVTAGGRADIKAGGPDTGDALAGVVRGGGPHTGMALGP